MEFSNCLFTDELRTMCSISPYYQKDLTKVNLLAVPLHKDVGIHNEELFSDFEDEIKHAALTSGSYSADFMFRIHDSLNESARLGRPIDVILYSYTAAIILNDEKITGIKQISALSENSYS